MNELEQALLSECRVIASHTLWNTPQPKGRSEMFDSEEREALAQRYFLGCRRTLEIMVYPDDTKDPQTVLRAVRYLATFAVPPMGTRVEWFSEGLLTLLNVAWPMSGVPAGGEPFFRDMRRGMAEAEAYPKNPPA